jgi:hypothetical protein
MSAMQASPSHRRSSPRAALAAWLQAGIVVTLIAGTAGLARAEAPEPPDDPAAAPAPADGAKQEPPASMPAPAAAAPSPKNYVTAVVGTTFAYKPYKGDFGGPLKDFNPAIGYGRLVTPTVAVELDAGLTIIKDTDTTIYLVPGVIWSFSTYVYVAMRFVVPVSPKANLVLYPGIGVIKNFSNGIGVSLEFNPSTTIGRGEPDFALPLNLGVLYAF